MELVYQVTVDDVKKRTTWRLNGVIHRNDGPAITHTNGVCENRQEYYRHGKRHRDDGPAIIEDGGWFRYYKNGQLHREDGPACRDIDGTEMFCYENELHREDGPAVVSPYGNHQYYIHGKRIPKEQFVEKYNRKVMTIKEIEAELGYTITVKG
jgi:antitoxin component YwqK of YwqJK toxin-antitoxin module